MRTIFKILLVCLFIFVLLSTEAQEAYLVKDISSISSSSEPRHIVKYDNTILFFANDGIHGTELWSSGDGLSEAYLLKDINPGEIGSLVINFEPVIVNNIMYFIANDGVNGYQVWRTDGTEQGTYVLKEIDGSSWNTEWNLAKFNELLVFYVNGNLWKSDGTNAGTVIFKEIAASHLNVFNNVLFFTTSDFFEDKSELWISDATESGTVKIKDFPGHNIFNSDEFCEYNGKLYFSAKQATWGTDWLWVSDGSSSGTKHLITNSGNYIANPSGFAVSNNLLFFIADNTNFNGSALWKSNGTPGGTVSIYNFKSIRRTSSPDLIDFQGKVFFVAQDSTVGNLNPSNRSLWKSDGTFEGTEFVKVINSTNIYSRNRFLVFNNSLYMYGYDSINGYELWKSDGTPEGTNILKNIYPYNGSSEIRYFTPFGDKLIFSANDNNYGYELWMTDGTIAGTALLYDINTFGDSYISGLTDVNGTLFFSGRDEINGQKLWTSNGTNAGTNRVIPELQHKFRNPGYITEFNGSAYFNGISVQSRAGQLYKSDGTTEGTILINNISLNNIFRLDSILFTDHCISDGTIEGTERITYSTIEDIVSVNNKFYFHSDYDRILKSDGTLEGTALFLQTDWFYDMISMNDTLFFSARSSSIRGLWYVDETTEEANLIKEIKARDFTEVEGTLFFIGYDNLNLGDYELWKSDGTEQGSVIVKNINLADSSHPLGLTNISGELYFIANDGIHGYELWKSDGTEVGTFMIKDIYSGIRGGFSSHYDSITRFIAIDSAIYFTANDGLNGFELWKTDGTEDGTIMVANLTSEGSSFPEELTNVGGTLFFTSYNDTYGRELWAFGTPPSSCLAEGMSFSTQNSIDNFPIAYAGCIKIEGEVEIMGAEIIDLSGFSNLVQIDGDLSIYNTSLLTNLSGLDQVTTLGGSLSIGNDSKGGNSSLISLSNLTNLSSINGDLVIRNNDKLTTINGLGKISSESINDLIITGNNLLSMCDVESVCNYLNNHNGFVDVQNNLEGCNNESEITESCTEWVNESNLSPYFNIYPNPAKTELFIANMNNAIVKEVNIYNQVGQNVLHRKRVTDKVDISRLGKGIYIIELISNDLSLRQKLVIK